MKEFNNRQIADQHAEYITGQALRKYAAEKVKKYVPDLKTVFDGAAGFRVIIVIEANSYVNIRSSRLLPNFKTQKINSWCAA